MPDKPRKQTRREFIADGARALGVLAVGGTLGSLATRGEAQDTVWQIDPDKCIGCRNCATECVLTPSAVKCVHEFERCGYCELCFGFFEDRRIGDDEGAENQRCPTGAIRRSFVEEPYYEYVIDEPKCIGCGVCVKGCQAYGNGALILQVSARRMPLCAFPPTGPTSCTREHRLKNLSRRTGRDRRTQVPPQRTAGNDGQRRRTTADDGKPRRVTANEREQRTRTGWTGGAPWPRCPSSEGAHETSFGRCRSTAGAAGDGAGGGGLPAA
jgi:electron transport complex protein RnfB